MFKMMIKPKLSTVREYVRHGERLFKKAKLSYGHGTGNAFDEAAFIVLETLGLPVDALEEHWGRALNLQEQEKIDVILAARIETRKPASYLLNKAYIRGYPFYVDERVIVPRSFIGEILCGQMEGDISYSFLEKREEAGTVLDLCTGSGCLAIIAADLFREAAVDAVDLSPGALAVARRNVEAYDDTRKRIILYEGDLFAPLAGKKYDILISNPPYVDARAMGDLPPEFRHEPAMALASGDDGLDIVRRILKEAPAHLNDDGGLLCEIGRGREVLVKEYPDIPFLWLDTEESSGEVFWITKDRLP